MSAGPQRAAASGQQVLDAVLAIARDALAGEQAWVVGGVVRDRLLGRAPVQPDVDLVVEGDPEAAARRVRDAASRGSAVFALSDAFGSWRVVGPGGGWQVDVSRLHRDGLEADLRARDLTLNAVAEPLGGGDLVDPTGGLNDLRDGILRAAGPGSFAADPLRILRVARLAALLGMQPDPATVQAARASAGALAQVSGERVFAELRGIVGAEFPSQAMGLLADLAATDVVLPELSALRGVEQTVYHHLDAHDHTLEVLDRVAGLQREPLAVVGELAAPVAGLLSEPLADDLDRAGALRWGALLHDIAKARTRTELGEGGYGFPGHDREGAAMAREILGRLRASERLRAHVAALARHHLRAGFLVRERPLSRRVVHDYLITCAPVEADVTLLSIADRMATRGRKAQVSIENHLAVALPLLADALRWHAEGPGEPLVRGDQLARELGLRPGPQLGHLLREIAAGQYAGELTSAAQALEHARRVLAG